MKKLLVVLLALAMAFAFAACGEQADTAADSEGLTAIPLGEGMEDMDVSDYGVYNQIDILPELADGMEEGDEIECYYSEKSDVPYIAVLHIPKSGRTMAEFADGAIEATGAAAWLDIEEADYVAYQCGTSLSDGKYYYVDCIVLENDDSFVQIDYFKNCEEVALGDSGQYLWIPSGYTDLMNDDEAEHGSVFYGEYDESYYLPGIWVGLDPENYQDSCWYLSEEFEEMPFDEAAYNKWDAADWDEASCNEYYKAIGFTKMEYFDGETNGIKYDICSCENDNGSLDEIYFAVDGVKYMAALYTDLIPDPIYAKVLMDSLHTK